MSLPPAFAYHGGKARLAPKIVGLMGDHRAYSEPFAGSLAVLLAKRPAAIEIVNDLNGDLVNFWTMLRDRPDDLIAACDLTLYARGEYDAAWELPPTDDPLERARRWWVKVQQGVAHKVGNKSGWQRGFADGGGKTPKSRTVRNKIAGLDVVAARIAEVMIECRPAVDVIESIDAPQVLHYVDPPYVGDDGNGWTGAYEHSMDADGHRELAGLLARCEGRVLLSGYPSPLYDDLYDGWHTVEFVGRADSANRSGGSNRRVERVWSNRPLTDSPSLFGGAA